MKLTLGQVISKIKILLSRITNIPVQELALRQELRKPELRFEKDAIRALHVRLNDLFQSNMISVTGDDTEACETISDLVELVWDSLDDKFKIEEI